MYLNVFDAFVFPSLYEGLGIVLIEAQSNGLKCFATKDTIPLEAKISENLFFIKLDNSIEDFSNYILNENY